MFTKGPELGQGQVDRILALWQAELPQYQHRNQNMTWARFWQEAAKGKRICNPMALKTSEREAYAVFSRPVNVALSNRIIMKKSNIAKLGNPDVYSLRSLLTNDNFRGVVQSTRSYTETIDQLIEEFNDSGNFHTLSATPHQMVQMILKNRIDYFIEYPIAANYLANKMSVPPNTLGSLAIEEIEPVTIGYVACPNTEWGRQVINDFNTAFTTVEKNLVYQQIMARWHSDQEIQQMRSYLQD